GPGMAGSEGVVVGDKAGSSMGDNPGDIGTTGSVVAAVGGGGVTTGSDAKVSGGSPDSAWVTSPGITMRQPGRMSSGSVRDAPSGWTRPMLAATTSCRGTSLSAASCDNVSPATTGTVLSPGLSPVSVGVGMVTVQPGSMWSGSV